MNDRERGWLEGILDGEGSFSLSPNSTKACRRGFSWQIKVGIVSTDRAIIEKVRAIIGQGSINSTPPRGLGKKTVFAYRIPVKAFEALRSIELVAKEKQKLLILEAADLISKQRAYHTPYDGRIEKIRLALRELNK